MLTIVEYSFLTPKRLGKKGFKKCCAAAGLRPNIAGYGLLHCHDAAGRRITAVTFEVRYLEKLISVPGFGGQQLPEGKFPIMCEGWPDDWTLKATPSSN